MGAKQRAAGYSSIVLFLLALRLLLPTIGREAINPLLADLQQDHRDRAYEIVLDAGFEAPANNLVRGAFTHTITSARIERDIYFSLRDVGIGADEAATLARGTTYTLGLANEVLKDISGEADRNDFLGDLHNNDQGYAIFDEVREELGDSRDASAWDARIAELAIARQEAGLLNDDFRDDSKPQYRDAFTDVYFNKEWLLPAFYALLIVANELRIKIKDSQKDELLELLTDGALHTHDQLIVAMQGDERGGVQRK